MTSAKQIDFKFKKNWSHFMMWFDSFVELENGKKPVWEMQAKMIECMFDSANPNVVNWTHVWKDLACWVKKTLDENGVILWNEQKRQIETLMLNQLKDFNKEQFILVFMHKGQFETSFEKMTYWEAVRCKEKLEGDSNGLGGDENVDKITVVNLKYLIL